MYLLDTNVVSELRRPERASQNFAAWFATVDASELYLSAISVLELELGAGLIARRDQHQGAMLVRWLAEQVLDAFGDRVLPVDVSVARKAASLHSPDPRPERDALIAATALVHKLTVVTRNVRDFLPTGVPLFNPWEYRG